jgi:hypothetical protein
MVVLLALAVSGAGTRVFAQNDPPAGQAAPAAARVRVYVDCQFECDTDYILQNVEFIDYVRDRAVADVHVLVTSEATGGGGRAWRLQFLGQQRFQGRDRTLTFTTPQTATGDDRRKEFVRVFKLGLVGYALETSVAPQLDVTWTRPAGTTAASTVDPWNYWVFRLGAGGFFNGEQTSQNRSLRFNVSGNRTTESWKINFSTGTNRNRNRFDVGDGDVITSVSANWHVEARVVKSVGAQWAVGGDASMTHSTFSNNDRAVTLAPGVEYNFFPYRDWSRKSLTLRYTAGATWYDYRHVTIFDKLSEVVPNHALNGSLGLRQPWGSLTVSARASQHFNDLDRYRITFFGSTDVRLFKGFSFDFFGEYTTIRDLIGLEKGDASTEDVLLRIRQFATGYSYFVNFGISYSFGSIFNNVVNPRFGGN